MDETWERTLDAVGGRLRKLRTNRGLTLAQVSAATGVSVSTLSRLESGGRRPTLELLLPLAREYQVPLDELVGAPPSGDPRIHIRPFRAHGHTILPLGRGAVGITAFKHVMPGRVAPAVPEPMTHPGHEWLYVLTGRLRLVLGDQDMVLGPGEAAEFDTRTPHWSGAAGPEAVEFLSLSGRSGERAHVLPTSGAR
ncbi:MULTISPECIES: helix-turn-helix domain-containing protein [unclassified Curtobacterium]|uniref:helix-turn-helix domain-containing protein n=1 Tax=unclassified Curtobacterium TaxID=257496 RepID=UPI000DA7B33B|nr:MULTISPECIES: XRE family transcriptional regulator [unclassified Curtobacterium]PZE27883.1 XRE family transcriptional regulator [Curtobacterium sp. MCBD17_028]PZE78348.1 XRE family transcriptional regulator [Curtobacterium sp. MCBD17_019]PZF59430.1 XRE family transcriptional regulator [Curtobacterium sp. MCBD17_013]WIB64165.1 XRE family transcriptional regulator [Curtobacterium sp. MCBD17_040]WIB67992.1 XRE family transcriptional regulator [Curtobacterium sp. MCBD17_035]